MASVNQYLEANGVSGYIWVANTFCSKKREKWQVAKRRTPPRIRYSERLCLVLEVVIGLIVIFGRSTQILTEGICCSRRLGACETRRG